MTSLIITAVGELMFKVFQLVVLQERAKHLTEDEIKIEIARIMATQQTLEDKWDTLAHGKKSGVG